MDQHRDHWALGRRDGVDIQAEAGWNSSHGGEATFGQVEVEVGGDMLGLHSAVCCVTCCAAI